MRGTIELSVVIPVYQAVGCIAKLVDRLEEVLSELTTNFELILVNDASPDYSWDLIKELAHSNQSIKGICLAENVGQHTAITAGLLLAQGEYVVIMDCDLQDQPEELPKLWKRTQEGCDIVMARRTQRKDAYKGRIISWCFHQILSLKRGIRTDSSIANYAIYHHRVIDLFKEQHSLNEPFSVLNILSGHSFASVEVIHGASARGYSSYTYKKLLKLAFSLLFPKQTEVQIPLFKISQTINFTIEKYGVTLRRLTEEKIEMVRQWRNAPRIVQYMEFREYITPEMQKRWFESINNEQNFYFVIEYEGEEIGLINTKSIDYYRRTAEGGLFIYNERFQNSDIALRASLAIIDFGVKVLHIETGSIHILSSNKRAIDFNRMIGYVLAPEQEHIENQLYILTKEQYYKQRKYLTRFLT